jgi:glutathione S-transferase
MQVKLRGALTADDGGFTRFARVLEGRVGASGWFVGDRPTAADIRMFTQVR